MILQTSNMVVGKLKFFHFSPLFTSHRNSSNLMWISFSINSQIHIHCVLWSLLPLSFWFLLLQGATENISFSYHKPKPFSSLLLYIIVKYRFIRDCTEIYNVAATRGHARNGEPMQWLYCVAILVETTTLGLTQHYLISSGLGLTQLGYWNLN